MSAPRYARGRTDYAAIRDLASDPHQLGAVVTEEETEEMLGCVPPIYIAGVHGFLVGEAITSDARGTVYANYYTSRDGLPCARYHCVPSPAPAAPVRQRFTAALTLCVSITVEAESEAQAESEARRFAENMGPQDGFVDGWNIEQRKAGGPLIIDVSGLDIEGAVDIERTDDDLAEAAEGETCDGCGRASIDCSRRPCDDVREDRGDASRWAVELIAEGIDVTGARDDVARLALEDAREFRTGWDYTAGDVEPADDEDRTEEPGDAEVTVTETARSKGGVSTFSATFRVVLTAVDKAEALTLARAFLAKR